MVTQNTRLEHRWQYFLWRQFYSMLHYKTLRKICFICDSHHISTDTEKGAPRVVLPFFCCLYYHRQASLNPRAHIILLSDVTQTAEGRFQFRRSGLLSADICWWGKKESVPHV